MFLMLFNLDFDSPSVILKIWLKNGVTGRENYYNNRWILI